jgi:predicted secreted protein
MSWATGLMVYLVIWWTVLFAILPFGVKQVENPGRGEDRGAPERPELKRKAIITSLVSAVLWLAFFVLQYYDVFSFRRMVDGLS